MIGKNQLQLGFDQFAAGMAISDYAQDGGLGTSSYNINPFSQKGVMRAIATYTDISTNVAGHIIASSEDSQSSSSYSRLFVDDSANYYTFSAPSTLTKTNTGTATSHYASGKTDMASFNNYTWVTLDNDIAQWNTSSTPVLTESWWVTTKAKTSLNSLVPHPLLVYQNQLFVADGSNLHFIDSSLNITTNAISLNNNELIYALGIDPFTGLMMISVQTNVNYSNSLSSKYFVYLYDGYSAKPTRKIPVEGLITAFYEVGGTVYVSMGNTIGTWGYTGVTYLRKFANVGNNGQQLAYKQHFANIDNILMVIDGQNVLAYGEVTQGKKGWFNVIQNPDGSSYNLFMVCHAGNNNVVVSSGQNNKLYSFPFMSTSTGTGALYFNYTYFPRPVFIRRVRIFTTGVAPTSGGGDVSIYDETATQHNSQVQQFVIPTGKTYYKFDFDFSNLKLQGMQLKINMDTVAIGLVKILIYYDVAE